MEFVYQNVEFPYLYDTHLHTKEASICASNSGAQMVASLVKAGYTGTFITNHFFYGNSSISRALSWNDWVTTFCSGYESGKKEAEKTGFQVFFAWESSYDATEFLVYGLNPQWLYEHPEIKDATIQEQFSIIRQYGGMIIHAHPFRQASHIPQIRLYPEFIDGVEVVNGAHSNILSLSHNHPEFDDKAKEYAETYQFSQTAGSDIHSTMLYGGGMAFSKKLEDDKDFIRRIKNREAALLLNGNEDFFKKI